MGKRKEFKKIGTPYNKIQPMDHKMDKKIYFVVHNIVSNV